MNMTVSPIKGASDVINRLNSQSKACPDQKFALVGYSQGAGVMHRALGPFPNATLEKSARSKIVAAVMFGDPGFHGTESPLGHSPAFADDILAVTRENCAPGDPVGVDSTTESLKTI
jgi:cutinase